MFAYWKKVDTQHQVIRAQWVFIGVLTLLSLLLLSGWKGAATDLNVYVPPSMVAQGGYVKPGKIPNEEVYSLAFQIFSAINVWNSNGEKDYLENINRYQNFVTPRFYQSLLNDYNERKQIGETNRVRMMSLYKGFDEGDVESIGPGVWKVHLQMRITERLDASSITSKDVLMDYNLRVVQTNISRAKNPVGLVVDGYVFPEKRIKSFV